MVSRALIEPRCPPVPANPVIFDNMRNPFNYDEKDDDSSPEDPDRLTGMGSDVDENGDARTYGKARRS